LHVGIGDYSFCLFANRQTIQIPVARKQESGCKMAIAERFSDARKQTSGHQLTACFIQ